MRLSNKLFKSNTIALIAIFVYEKLKGQIEAG